jgi:hypothetical protein
MKPPPGSNPKIARKQTSASLRSFHSPNDDALIVDRLLRKLRHADPQLRGEGQLASRPKPRPTPKAVIGPAAFEPDWRMPWLWATLGVILAVGLAQWPYARPCGLPLAGYVAVLVLLLATGVYAALSSWRHRRPVAHVISLLVILAALAFAAEVTLPRAGYAKIVATWACGG